MEKMIPELVIGKVHLPVAVWPGGMAVRISGPKLAAAAGNNGGLAVIAGSGMKPEALKKEILKTREMTAAPIGVNLMFSVLDFEALVEVIISTNQVSVLLIGAGFSRDGFAKAKAAGIAVVPIVSSAKAAWLGLRSGADALVIEGGKAGGHLGTDRDVWEILPEVQELFKSKGSAIPIILAGGILTGEDIARALQAGASGVQMGTRFALSKESNAAKEWKETLLTATPEQVIVFGGEDENGVPLPGSPVGYRGRVVVTNVVEHLLEDGVFHYHGKKYTLPGCHRSCLKDCQYRDGVKKGDFHRDPYHFSHCIFNALNRALIGDRENGLHFTGKRVTEIKEELSVDEIYAQLRKNYAEALCA